LLNGSLSFTASGILGSFSKAFMATYYLSFFSVEKDTPESLSIKWSRLSVSVSNTNRSVLFSFAASFPASSAVVIRV